VTYSKNLLKLIQLKDENPVSEETATKIAKVIYWDSLLKDEEAGLSLNYEDQDLGNVLTELKSLQNEYFSEPSVA
jgi:hypothetical protein